jgi:cell wall-associated NlpC family hydrolase
MVCAAIFVAAVPAQAVPSQTEALEVYQVRQGDTLWSLAQRFGTTPERLAALNEITTESILSIGQRLKVPASGSDAQRGAAPGLAAPRRAPGLATYRVRAGDTLYAIARRHGTKPEHLAVLNGIALNDTLRIGQSLKVPGAPAASVSSAADRVAPRPRLAAQPSRGERWAATVVALSTRYVGVRYRWGGTTPAGFDCSGFMNYVFERTGVTLPRTTYAMFDTGMPVAREQLQTGDIVFFETVAPGPSHAGIYLGDGRFIHSSSGAGAVTISPLNHRYYAPRYLGARRF